MKKTVSTLVGLYLTLSLTAGNIDGKPFNTHQDSIPLTTNFGVNGINETSISIKLDKDFLRSTIIYTLDGKLITYDNLKNGIFIVKYKETYIKMYIRKED